MASFNKVLLMGNLTRDPELELKESRDGEEYASCRFGIAVNEKWGDDNERVDFFNCTATGGLAEVIANYKEKGDPIFLEGKLRYYSWEDDETGEKRSTVNVKVTNVQFLNRGGQSDDEDDEPPRKKKSSGRSNKQRRQKEEVEVDEEDFADIPF